MSDFLDRLGDQLKAAAPASGAAPRRTAAGRSVRTGRRSVVIAGCVLAVAAPGAVALVSSWEPDLNSPRNDRAVSADETPVNSAAVNAFSFLRRDQTDADRAAADSMIRTVGLDNQVDKIQTAGVRRVAPGWIVVPAMTARTGPNADDIEPDQLCLTNGSTVGCSSTQSALKNGIGILSASKSHTTFEGAVPDGVTRVRFTLESGETTEAPVEGNFYTLSVEATRQLPDVKTPGGQVVPAPPTPAAGTLAFLDRDGKVVGPAQPRI